MAGNGSSYETSWADQWDYSEPQQVTDEKKKSNASAKYKQKIEEGLGKTKAVASSGVNKLKEGTSVGLNWIKAKYAKTTQKS